MDVHGVDLATNMIELAQDYRAEMEPEVKHRVQFYLDDATTMAYPRGFYDVVYRWNKVSLLKSCNISLCSRDTILHIDEKEELFRKFLHTLKPGGKLMISDYCHGDQVDIDGERKRFAQQFCRSTARPSRSTWPAGTTSCTRSRATVPSSRGPASER